MVDTKWLKNIPRDYLIPCSMPSVEPVSVSINISEEEHDQPVKSAYHSFYVYPRSQGNKSNSPNLLWHELKTQG